MVLKKVKGGWKVYSQEGQPLSRYPKTKEEARKQLSAIEISKKKRSLQ